LKVAIASDLHLEFSGLHENFFGNPENADILILAGDTVESRNLSYFSYVFRRISEDFEKVFIVLGNHEFYLNEIQNSVREMLHLEDEFDNIRILNNKSFILHDKIILVGGTLWTNYNKLDPFTIHGAKSRLNDYRHIRVGDRLMIPEDCIEWHNETVNYIQTIARSNQDKKVIVATHHAPTFLSINSMYKGDYHGSGLFASDLSNLILDEENIVLWAHGHTHDACEYEVGNCKVVCNPKGYSKSADYKCKVVEV
jgi:predicted phosphohydrolase